MRARRVRFFAAMAATAGLLASVAAWPTPAGSDTPAGVVSGTLRIQTGCGPYPWPSTTFTLGPMTISGSLDLGGPEVVTLQVGALQGAGRCSWTPTSGYLYFGSFSTSVVASGVDQLGRRVAGTCTGEIFEYTDGDPYGLGPSAFGVGLPCSLKVGGKGPYFVDPGLSARMLSFSNPSKFVGEYNPVT